MHPFFVRSLHKLGWLSSINTSTVLSFEGKKIEVPLKGNLGYNYLNLSEPWMTEVLKKLKPLYNGNFIDIGVNMGQSLLKAYVVFDSVNYFGFEPNPACINYVQELVKLNGFNHCALFPIGISDEAGILKLQFFSDDESDQSASIIENFRATETVVSNKYVPIFDLNILRQYLPDAIHSILKIDVEGAELNVLEGLSGWIRTALPVILVEILPVYSSENEFRMIRQEKLESLLKRLDYIIFRLSKNHNVKASKIQEIGIHGNVEDGDYILAHKSIAGEIEKLFS